MFFLYDLCKCLSLNESQMQPANKTHLLNSLLDRLCNVKILIVVLLFVFEIGIKLSLYMSQKSCEEVHRKQKG